MKTQKLLLACLFLVLFGVLDSNSQDLVNPYKQNYDGVNINNLIYTPYETWPTYDPTEIGAHQNTYNGEYQIILNKFPWTYSIQPMTSAAINSALGAGDFVVTYKIEAVSFPFYCPCAFDYSVNSTTGGCADNVSSSRVLKVPDDINFDQANDNWTFTLISSLEQNKLSLVVEKPFSGIFSQPSDLVSIAYCSNWFLPSSNDVFPHTILKHTVSIHATASQSSPVISSFSFLVDPTRGRLREYPYYDINTYNNHTRTYYDVCIRPEIWNDMGTPNVGGWLGTFDSYNTTNTGNCDFYNEQGSVASCPDYVPDLVRGGTIDYTPFSLTNDNNCALASPDYDALKVGSLSATYFSGGKYQKIPLPPYAFVAGTFPRNDDAVTYTGYRVNGNSLQALNTSPAVHRYEVDKNITLENINPVEKVIYNPSEVFITSGANNLRFPANYTFKTICATYPFEYNVAAENTSANGGPYSNPRDVPVTTDLRVDYHDTYGYPTNDPKYSSVYHLEPGSKVSVEPCVKLFDCTFDVQTGSELFFENWPTNQINVSRYGILLNGGKLTKADVHFYFQNKNEVDRILEFQSGSTIEAGSYVDNSSSFGPYTVEPNADVTFIANDEITLADGFTASAGSDFDARISPVLIPACPPHRPAGPTHTTLNYKQKANEALRLFSNASLSPNPANQNTEIKFSVNSLKHVSLKIFDAYGREMKTIINNVEFKEGNYTFNFDASVLNPGVYYCKLFSSDEEEIMKLIKIN